MAKYSYKKERNRNLATKQEKYIVYPIYGFVGGTNDHPRQYQ